MTTLRASPISGAAARKACAACGVTSAAADDLKPLEPVVPGHLLVVPAQHVEDATENPLVTGIAAGVAARVAMRYPSANILTSIGEPATQSVFHLHWHVVPRRDGDGLLLPWVKP